MEDCSLESAEGRTRSLALKRFAAWPVLCPLFAGALPGLRLWSAPNHSGSKIWGETHCLQKKAPAQFGYGGKQSRCGLPFQHAPLNAGEKKDTMLMFVIHALTIILWATASVAVCGIALGFLGRTITGRTPYRRPSRPVAAAVRWEKNWHR